MSMFMWLNLRPEARVLFIDVVTQAADILIIKEN